MARIRTIKPEFWTDEKVVSLSPLARLLFIGLWNFADDEGRGELSPRRMKMQILPADDADCSALLGEIRGESLIAVYAVDGKDYFQIVNFGKHQKVDRRTPSKYPAPTLSPEFPRVPPTEGKGMEWKGMEEASEPNGSGAAAPTGRVVSLDARTALFREGLDSLVALTGRPATALRPLLGKWLKACGDDCAAVLAVINRAREHRPAEPIAWIEKGLRPADPDAAIYRGAI